MKTPAVRGNEAGAFWDGVLRCRSRECAVCFYSRRLRLLSEVHHVAEQRAHETKRRPLLATLTVRHSAADGVNITKQVRTCWSKFTSGRAWQDFKTRYEPEWICAEEITRGENGWHPHIHVAIMPKRDPSDVLETASWWYERWAAIVAKHMGPQHLPLPSVGTDLRQGSAVDYVAKLAWELSDAACVKGSTPVALIEAGHKDLYLELQRFRKRARDVTWSQGLRAHRDSFLELPKPETELFAVLRGSEYERLAERGWQALHSLTEAHNADDADSKLRYHGARAAALGAEECAAFLDSSSSSIQSEYSGDRAGGGLQNPRAGTPPKTIWEREHGL